MKITLLKIVFTSIIYCISIQVNAQFLGGDQDGHANLRLTNISCIAINNNPFLGGESDGHSNSRISNVSCPVINNNPFAGGESDGHSNSRILNISCPVINNNPFAGGESDGHSNVRITTIICPVENVNPFLGGEADGHSNEKILNNPLCIPLPIELLSFTATPFETAVQLNWSTASEINNDYFTIERSESGVSFEKIEQIDGAGNSLIILNYSSLDKTPLYGISFYRLMQTDFNGQNNYSKIISANIENKNVEKIKVYPSPFTNELTIEKIKYINNAAKYEIINALGATLLSGYLNQKTTLSTSSLTPGVYVIKIDNGDFLEYQKIIKE